MKALEMRSVSVVRDGKYILDSINLSIDENESVAIIGKNGSGKTTLIKLILGEVRPYYDCAFPPMMRIFGEENWNIFDIRSKMGIVSMDLQNRFAPNTLVSETVISGFFGSLDVFKNTEPTSEMISKAKEMAFTMGVDHLWDRMIEGLSLGEMRRILIARALVTGPRTLVMDEPMSGLDIVMASKFKKMFDILIGAGVNLIIVTHDLGDIPTAINRVIMIKDGKILEDGAKKRLLTSEKISELYDESITVECNAGMYHMHIQA